MPTPSRCPFIRGLASALRRLASSLDGSACPCSAKAKSDCACTPGTVCTANRACPRLAEG